MKPAGMKAGVRVAFIWQRFLSYHLARLFHLQRILQVHGYSLSALQIASRDSSYLFPEDSRDAFDTVFPGEDYHDLNTKQIYDAVLGKLRILRPTYPIALKALDHGPWKASACVEKIFKIFRIDAFWRLNYQLPNAIDNFGIKFGFQVTL